VRVDIEPVRIKTTEKLTGSDPLQKLKVMSHSLGDGPEQQKMQQDEERRSNMLRSKCRTKINEYLPDYHR